MQCSHRSTNPDIKSLPRKNKAFGADINSLNNTKTGNGE